MSAGPARRPPDAAPDLPVPDDAPTVRDLVRVSVVALLGGLGVGAVGGLFRAALAWADVRRLSLIHWSRGHGPLAGLLPVLLAAVAAGVARLVVRFVPAASGSGVQRVEATMRGELAPDRWPIVPAKFVGGWLSIGVAGMALGREGPTVQMGGTVGAYLSGLARQPDGDVRDLQSALAGAGLAVAFNAPLGGAMFVFEEVAHAFRLRLVLATLLGCAGALSVSRLIIGSSTVFVVGHVAAPAGWTLVSFLVFGAVLGAMGAAYNKAVLFGLDAFARARLQPVELRAGVVGAVVGIVAVLGPVASGGGEGVTQRVLDGGLSAGALLAILVARWLLGPVSYAAGTPGGLFAPLLAVGALAGQLFGVALRPLGPGLAPPPATFAIVGMAAFFAAVVRAPFTGMLLIVEMTGTAATTLPMIAASFSAVLVATLLGSEPIYDTLRDRMLGRPPRRQHAAGRR